jgi:membrane-associated phospholipid phosphatase
LQPLLQKQNITLSLRVFLILSAIWFLACSICLVVHGNFAISKNVNATNTYFWDMFNTCTTSFGQAHTLLPAFLIPFVLPACRNKRYLLGAILYLVFVLLFVYVLKQSFSTLRPLMLIPSLHRVNWLDQAYNKGLPSGHTTAAFAFSAYFLSSYKMPVFAGITFFLTAALCGLSRIYLAQHFMGDVILGTALGIFIGLLISFILNKIFK